MGENKVKIILDVDDKGSVKISKFGSETEKTFAQLESKSSAITAGFKGLGAALVGAFAVEKIVAFGSSCVEAYAQAETAEKALAEAMRQRGVYTEQALQRNIAFAEQVQALTAYDHESVEAVQKKLTYYGAEGETLERLTQATLDLAAAKDMDLATAGDKVAKAVAGSARALKAYGVEVDGAKFSQQRMLETSKQLEAMFGGAAQAQLQTYAGQVTHLKNTWGETKEAIGGALMPVMTPLLEALAGAAERTAQWAEKNKDLIAAPIDGTVDLWTASVKGLKSAVEGVSSAWDVLLAKPWKMITEKLDQLTPGYGTQSALEQHRANRKTSSGLTTEAFADRQNNIPLPPAAPAATQTASTKTTSKPVPLPEGEDEGSTSKPKGRTTTSKPVKESYTPSWEYGFDTGPGWLPENTAPSWLEQQRGQAEQDALEQRQAAEEQEQARKDLERQTAQSALNTQELAGGSPFEVARGREELGYQDEQDALAEKYAGQLGLQEEYQLAAQALADEHAAAMGAIDRDEAAYKKQQEQEKWLAVADISSTFGASIMSMAKGQSRTMFNLGKAASIAGAIINTYEMAVKSYDSLAGIPIVGPALGAAAAAAAITYGMAQINQIRAAKFEGRARGGPVLPGHTYLVGEAGEPEVLVMGPSGGGRVVPLGALPPAQPALSAAATTRPRSSALTPASQKDEVGRPAALILGSAAAGRVLPLTALTAWGGTDADNAPRIEARALGGPVERGRRYIVGESGPEILDMGSARGTVIPNTALTPYAGTSAPAATEIHLTQDLRGAVIDGGEAFKRRVIEALEEHFAAGGTLKQGGF